MTSFMDIEGTAIGNNLEKNYYVNNDLHEVEGIDNNFDYLIVYNTIFVS